MFNILSWCLLTSPLSSRWSFNESLIRSLSDWLYITKSLLLKISISDDQKHLLRRQTLNLKQLRVAICKPRIWLNRGNSSLYWMAPGTSISPCLSWCIVPVVSLAYPLGRDTELIASLDIPRLIQLFIHLTSDIIIYLPVVY